MSLGIVSKFVLITSVVSAVAVVRADLSHPLVNHAGAVASGSVDILAGSGHQFNITIDYAVFLPGQFAANGGNFNPFASFSAFNSNDFVYAYQIYSNGSDSGVPNPSTAAMSKLGVDVSQGVIDSMGYDLGFDPGTGEVNASSAYAYANSFLFAFNPRLDPDHRSAILLVSSPNSWKLEPVCILNGGLSGSASLPAPHHNPAPSPPLLVMIGVSILAMFRPHRPLAALKVR